MYFICCNFVYVHVCTLSNGDFPYTEVVLVDTDNSEEATATAGEIQRRFLVCMFSSMLGVYVCCVCVFGLEY